MNELSTSAFQPIALGYSTNPATNGCRMVSRNDSAILSRQGEISLTTKEGDRVTISASWASAYHSATSASQQGGNILNSYSASVLEQGAYSLTVEGDLNQEELKDIEKLIGKLSSIAYDFFSGNQEQAIQQALNIGEMGSISELYATFIQSSFISSQSISQWPTKSSNNILSDFAALDKPVKESYPYHQMAQAQWQQIKMLIETGTAPGKTLESSSTASTKSLSEAFFDELTKTMSKHPRLSPLSIALAEKSVELAQERFMHNHPESWTDNNKKGEQLLSQLKQRLDQWLLS